MVPAVRGSEGRGGGAFVVAEGMHEEKDSESFIRLAAVVVKHQVAVTTRIGVGADDDGLTMRAARQRVHH
jgi:hypothetical protein